MYLCLCGRRQMIIKDVKRILIHGWKLTGLFTKKKKKKNFPYHRNVKQCLF